MKTQTCFSFALALIVAIGFFTTCLTAEGTHHNWDKAGYDKTAKKIIGSIVSGNINPEQLKIHLETLLNLGIKGCEEHMAEKETPEKEKKLMELTINNAKKMADLTLEEIENQWHDGGAAKAAKIEFESYDHFDEVMCHYDAVVHPATCIICIKAYEKSPKDEYLEQIQDELAEVREHLKHLE